MDVRRSIVTCVVALCVTGQASIALAQTDAAHHYDTPPHYDGPLVSLDALLAEAQANNLELVTLRAQVAVVRERPAQERGLPPPMVEATIWQWPTNSINPADVNMYMFTVSQDLPGRGKRDLRAAVADTDVAIAEGDVAVRARQIVDEIKQAYGALYIARKAIDVHLSSVDLLRRIADAAEIKYTTGKSSQQDVLKPVLELTRLHTDIIMFDEQASVAAARLNALVNRPTGAPFGPLEDPHEEALLPAVAQLEELAIARHPELKRARLDVEHSQAELSAAARDHQPDFSVSGGYMLLPNQTDGIMARVGVTWPNAPWSRTTIDAHVGALTAAVASARARVSAMESAARLNVQEAYVHAKAAQERAALLRTTIVPQSQQLIDVSQLEFESDKGEFASLIANERALLDVRLDYVRALSDFQLATADLERAIGTDLPAGTTQPFADVTGGGR
jgi:outer membrane protein TolC